MSFALELRGVSKRFVVGSPGCTGTVHALQDVDIQVCAGEIAALVGPPGAGKSTLLLCAAGLLRVDAGEVRRFGSTERALALSRATYHFAGLVPAASGGRRPRHVRDEPHIHLIDGHDVGRVLTERRSQRWMVARCTAGDAVLVAVERAAQVGDVESRIITLRRGRIHRDSTPPVTRVAEEARLSS